MVKGPARFSRRESHRRRYYFKGGEGASQLSSYGDALQMLREAGVSGGVLINYGCGYDAVPEYAARLKHARRGFAPRFLQVDTRLALADHKYSVLTAIRRLRAGRSFAKKFFDSDAYVARSIERLKPVRVFKAVGVRPTAGLALGFLFYYPVPKKIKLIKQMLRHCDTLVVGVERRRVHPQTTSTNHGLVTYAPAPGPWRVPKELFSKQHYTEFTSEQDLRENLKDPAFDIVQAKQVKSGDYRYEQFLLLIKRKQPT